MGQIRGGGRGSGEDAAEAGLSAGSEPARADEARLEAAAPPETPAPGAPSAGTPGLPGTPDASRDRILTIPNGLSVLRLIGVPVFLWLVLGPHLDGWAVALLILSPRPPTGSTAKSPAGVQPAEQAGGGARPRRGPAVHRGHAGRAGRAEHHSVVAARPAGAARTDRGRGAGTAQAEDRALAPCRLVLWGKQLLFAFCTHFRCCSSERTRGTWARSPGSSGGRSHLGHRVVLVGGGPLPGPDPDAAHRPPDPASGPWPGPISEGSGVSIEGCGDGRRRRDPAASYDRQPAKPLLPVANRPIMEHVFGS